MSLSSKLFCFLSRLCGGKLLSLDARLASLFLSRLCGGKPRGRHRGRDREFLSRLCGGKRHSAGAWNCPGGTTSLMSPASPQAHTPPTLSNQTSTARSTSSGGCRSGRTYRFTRPTSPANSRDVWLRARRSIHSRAAKGESHSQRSRSACSWSAWAGMKKYRSAFIRWPERSTA